MKTGPFRLPPLAVLAAASGLVLLFAVPAAGQQQQMAPAAVQVDTFTKVFPFDRRLGDLSELRVVLLRPAPVGAWGPLLDELERAFSAQGIVTLQAGLDELRGALSPTTVVYLVPETATPDTLSAIADAGALTISGLHDLAESGHVSVALDARGARPEVVVNIARVEQERHELSAQLLRVARVVRQGTGGSSRPAQLVSMDQPQYTAMARRMGIQGEVVVRIRVSAAGKVEEVELIRGIAQNVGLNEAALEAARGASFEPALRDGQPVEEWVTQRFRFAL